VVVLLLVSDAGSPVVARPTSRRVERAAARPMRDWRGWPFSRRSPWNYPIGSGAHYVTVPRLAQFDAGINYDGRWTSSVVVATDSDPLATMFFSPNYGADSTWAFLNAGGQNCDNSPGVDQQLLSHAAETAPPTEGNYYSTASASNNGRAVMPLSYHLAGQDWRGIFHLPAGACPSPDTDGLLAVFEPDGWVLDSYATVVTNGAVIATMASWIDARGDGTGWWNGRRASMLPSFAGLIRTGEITSGRIPHALAAQVPAGLLKKAFVWPAAAFDRDANYSGSLPMGALLAIPPKVDLDTLGLSTYGKVIARAAQDYGVYVVDRGGAGISFLAELNNPDIRWEQRGAEPAWWQDVQVIKNNLQWVNNNSPSARGGGGTPRVTLPAHLRPND
jgi:hypothetical protein